MLNEIKNQSISEAIKSLQEKIYNQNKETGWHSDLNGEPFSEEKQKELFPTRIALCHSELSEALEGFRKDRQDDHLPEFENADIELADAVIRIFELAYVMGYDLGNSIQAKLHYNKHREDHKVENRRKNGGKKI